jgi:hypothetical protein
MKKEVRVALNKMLSEGESPENIFTKLYMVGGYPANCFEDLFCDWLREKKSF